MPRIAVLLLIAASLAACAPERLPGTKVGKPYSVGGTMYYPSYDLAYDKVGEASWYGPGFHGKYTASGETYNQNDITAAHPTLPMPSLVRVTNLSNGKSAIIRINDRGPFAANRIIDLSKKSAQTLDIRGVANVRVQYLEHETQDYLNMVQANDGRIIPMADYNRRIAEISIAQAAAEISPSSNAAPVEQKSSLRPSLIREAMADETLPQSLGMEETALPPDAPGVSQNSIIESNDIVAEEKTAPAETPAASREIPAQPEIKTGGYMIQLGSFASEANARKLAKKMAGAMPSVEKVDAQGGQWWRVRIANIKDRYTADSLLEKVHAAGVPDARIVRQ